MMAPSTLSCRVIRATCDASKDGSAASHGSAASGQTSPTPAVRTSRLPSALRARTAMLSVVIAMAVGAGELAGGGTTGEPLSSVDPTTIATTARPAIGARDAAGMPRTRRPGRAAGRRWPGSASIAAAVRAHRSRGGSGDAARRAENRRWTVS